tara:strand:+ start:496 stop:759 length:264 start_codon:yes stop_codon:yes gene_type:complete
MTKLTLREYVRLSKYAQEKHGPFFDPESMLSAELFEADFSGNDVAGMAEMFAALFDAAMDGGVGLTLAWDAHLKEWCVQGPLNQPVH